MSFFTKLLGNEPQPETDLSTLLANENFTAFLNQVEDISIGNSELRFVKATSIEEVQLDYRKCPHGQSFTGKKPGDWKKNWIVIAKDDLGEPIFVDCAHCDLPVYTAPDWETHWKEIRIASSLGNFKQILEEILKLKTSNEDSPIEEAKVDDFLEKIKAGNKRIDLEFWEDFLLNYGD